MGGLNWTEAQYEEYLKRTGKAEENLETLEETLSRIREERYKTMRMLTTDVSEQPEPKFKSKTERRAWEQWVPTTGCVEAYYEAVRVYLNSGSYQPDFTLRMPNRELWFIEVKGSWSAYKSGRSSKKSLIEASRMFWWLGRWYSLLPKKGGGWDLEEIK